VFTSARTDARARGGFGDTLLRVLDEAQAVVAQVQAGQQVRAGT